MSPRTAKCASSRPQNSWRLATQHDLRPAQMGLQLGQRALYLPAFMVEGRQVRSGRLRRVQDRGHQPIQRLGVGHALQPVFHLAHLDAVGRVPPVLLARIDHGEIGPVRQHRCARQAQVAFHPPQQVGAGGCRCLPQRIPEEVSVGQAQHARPKRRQHAVGGVAEGSTGIAGGRATEGSVVSLSA